MRWSHTTMFETKHMRNQTQDLQEMGLVLIKVANH